MRIRTVRPRWRSYSHTQFEVFVCECVDCFMCFLLIFVTFENIELQNIAVCFDALFHLSRLLKIKDDLVRAVLCLY